MTKMLDILKEMCKISTEPFESLNRNIRDFIQNISDFNRNIRFFNQNMRDLYKNVRI